MWVGDDFNFASPRLPVYLDTTALTLPRISDLVGIQEHYHLSDLEADYHFNPTNAIGLSIICKDLATIGTGSSNRSWSQTLGWSDRGLEKMTRSKVCLPCKLRRKKCDEHKPVCVACMRNALICTWGPSSNVTQRIMADAASVSRIPPAHSQLRQSSIGKFAHSRREHLPNPRSPIQGLGALHPQLGRHQAGILYSFFLEKAAQAISICDENSNPFIHIMTPMAFKSDMILHAILAFSGVVFLQHSSQDLAHAVWEQYAQAVRSLKHNLTRYIRGEKDLAIHVLLTSLLLCALEVCNADTHNHALLHLTAAQQVISVAEAHCSSSSPLFCLAAELYSYNVALLPSCLSESAEHPFDSLGLCFRAMMHHRNPFVGVLCGSSFTLFPLIPDVYTVCTAINDAFQAAEDIPLEHTLSRQRLLSLVLFWRPETLDEDSARCGRIYQFALLGLLHIQDNTPGSLDYASSYRRQLIINLIDVLQTLPVESNHTTILCWPLAVLGGYAEEAQHRDIIRDYLTQIANKYRLGNMYQTLQLLELIWDRADLRRIGPRCLPVAMEAQGYQIMLT